VDIKIIAPVVVGEAANSHQPETKRRFLLAVLAASYVMIRVLTGASALASSNVVNWKMQSSYPAAVLPYQ